MSTLKVINPIADFGAPFKNIFIIKILRDEGFVENIVYISYIHFILLQ